MFIYIYIYASIYRRRFSLVFYHDLFIDSGQGHTYLRVSLEKVHNQYWNMCHGGGGGGGSWYLNNFECLCSYICIYMPVYIDAGSPSCFTMTSLSIPVKVTLISAFPWRRCTTSIEICVMGGGGGSWYLNNFECLCSYIYASIYRRRFSLVFYHDLFIDSGQGHIHQITLNFSSRDMDHSGQHCYIWFGL